MVIDDDEIICGYCKEVLKSQFDFQVDTFLNGKDALKNADEKDYSLIITDLFLPDTSGFELVPEIIYRYGQVPIIVISGIGSLNDAIEAIRLGAYDYIHKPFSRMELEHVVKRVLDRARALEERALLNKEVLNRIQMEKELSLARKLISGFLPGERIIFSDFTFLGMDFPSKEVGGDFYNYFWLDEDRFVFLIGDVSGSGVPAALVSGMAKLAIDSVFQFKPDSTPADIIRELNFLLFKNLDHKTYVSMFLGIMNSKDNIIDYCSAGHLPVLVLRDDGVFELSEGGGLLGIFHDYEFSNGTFSYRKDDSFFLYTDGIFNSLDHNFDDEEKFKDYVKTFFSNHKDDEYSDFKNAIRSDLLKGISRNQNDDVAIVIMKNFQLNFDSSRFVFSGEDILNGKHADHIINFIKSKLEKENNTIYDFVYALREIINNSYVYGYKRNKNSKIFVKIFISENNIIEGIVQDYGEGFAFNEYNIPYLENEHGILRISGRGIYIVKSLMDSVWVSSIMGRGTQFIVKKRILDD